MAPAAEYKTNNCPAGVWTIGFGHTKDVHAGEHITRNEAYDLLTKDLVQTQEELAAIVKVPITENQFITLMSWLFNLGLTPAVRRSTLLRKLNAGDYEGDRKSTRLNSSHKHRSRMPSSA